MLLWAKVKTDQKIVAQAQCDYPHDVDISQELLLECLSIICTKLDLSRPIVLKKHVTEIQDFGGTRFTKSDFIEKTNYDWLEIEIIEKPKN